MLKKYADNMPTWDEIVAMTPEEHCAIILEHLSDMLGIGRGWTSDRTREHFREAEELFENTVVPQCIVNKEKRYTLTSRTAWVILFGEHAILRPDVYAYSTAFTRNITLRCANNHSSDRNFTAFSWGGVRGFSGSRFVRDAKIEYTAHVITNGVDDELESVKLTFIGSPESVYKSAYRFHCERGMFVRRK